MWNPNEDTEQDKQDNKQRENSLGQLKKLLDILKVQYKEISESDRNSGPVPDVYYYIKIFGCSKNELIEKFNQLYPSPNVKNELR